jgi:hypothetical protein
VFQHLTSSKIGSNDTQSSTSVLKIKLGNIVVMSLQNEFTQTQYE